MNQSKISILKCLSGGGWLTTTQVSRRCGLKLTNVSELLRRYRGLGLVNRERNYRVPRGYLYKITSVGIERLRYFNSGVPDTGGSITGIERLRYFNSGTVATSSSMADYIGLHGEKKQIFEQWISKKLGGV